MADAQAVGLDPGRAEAALAAVERAVAEKAQAAARRRRHRSCSSQFTVAKRRCRETSTLARSPLRAMAHSP